MRNYKFWSLLSVLLIAAITLQAQTKKQFNGKFSIYEVSRVGDGIYNIRGSFSDPGSIFNASDVQIGDRIVDNMANTFEILSFTVNGSEIMVSSKSLEGKDGFLGEGIIFRPTGKGFPLTVTDIPAELTTKIINTAVMTIDEMTSVFSSGTSLPASSSKVGDVLFNTSNSKHYLLTASGWSQISDDNININYDDNAAAIPPGVKGDIVRNYFDNRVYVFDGNSWVAAKEASSLPGSFKFGDVFYVTGEQKMYMCNADSKWVSISGASIPGGTEAEQPTNSKTGDLFFNTGLNTLFVFNVQGKWVEVSTNGSTPAGSINPDLADASLKVGSLFYNTADNKIYVNNGKAWLPLDNSLRNGNIFVGNVADVATSVSLSGDATLGNTGKLSIKASAITDEKLDKSNIPLSGFGYPLDNVSMGDGVTNYKIANLANPTTLNDAATKGYVDAIMSTPGSLTLASTNLFIGNAQNKAVAVPKSNVPISGFGNALSSISMGAAANGAAPAAYYKITNMADPTVAQDAATKNYVDTRVISAGNLALAKGSLFIGNDVSIATAVAKNTIPLSGFGAAVADISIGAFKLNNVADPVAEQDAATKNYVDTKIINPASINLSPGNLLVGDASGKAAEALKNTVPVSGFGAALADVSLGGFALTNVAAPLADEDASTKKYVDDLFKAPSTSLALPTANFFMGNASGKAEAIQKRLVPISGFAKAADNIYMGDAAAQYGISFLAEPLFAQDAATKNYVDNQLATVGGKDNLGNHEATQNIKLSQNSISNDGSIGKGLTFDGTGSAFLGQDLTLNGTFYVPSDFRLKTHIETLTTVLQNIDRMRGVRFEYKDQHKYAAGPKIGVIAQELQKVYPEMVTQGKNGFLKVDYTQLTGVLIQAVKEQQDEIEQLKLTLKKQQQQIDAILEKIKLK